MWSFKFLIPDVSVIFLLSKLFDGHFCAHEDWRSWNVWSPIWCNLVSCIVIYIYKIMRLIVYFDIIIVITETAGNYDMIPPSVKDLTKKLPGFELPRTIWTTINRIRTEQGRYNFLLHNLEWLRLHFVTTMNFKR